MPDEPKAPAGSSGLHASAAPYVPAAAPAGKPNEGKAAGDAAPTSSSTAATATALNGNTPQPANSSSSSASQPAAAGGKGAGGQKGSKAAAKQQQQQQTPTSKLAAAASAAPFVPGSGGKPGNGPGQAAGKEAKQQQGKQGGKAGKQGKQQGGGQQNKQQQQQQQDQKGVDQKGADQKEKDVKDKEPKAPAPAGKMSAAAAAFVPKSAPGTPAAGSSGGGSSSSSAQQPRGTLQASSSSSGTVATPSAAARLKSPLKGSNSAATAAASSSSTPAAAAAAATASPARPGPAAGGRGGRAARNDSSRGSSSNLGLNNSSSAASGGGAGGGGPSSSSSAMGGGAAAAGMYGGSRAVPASLSGLGGAGGGPKRALLAQFQGNYQYGAAGMAGGHFGAYGHAAHHHAHHHHHGAPGKQLLSAQFMSEGLRQQLQQANYLTQLQYTPSGDEPPLPDKIAHYHTLYPLEDLSSSELSAAWGVRSSALKGLSARDGRAYVLRVVCGKQGLSARDGRAYVLRVVCGKQVIPSLEMLSVVRSAVDMWACLAGHPGLLVPLEGLVASELDGSPSLVVVHSYVPGAVTLAQAHLQPTQTASGQLVRNTPNEELLWSYTVQLAAILRAAHATGLALRPAALSATKVLLTPVGRLKVCGLGVAEALTGEVVPGNSEDLLALQRDDVVAMGQLLLQLACAVGSLPAPNLDFAAAHYSAEFVRLLVLLLGVADGGGFSWRAVSALLGERLMLEVDALAMFNEQLLEDLSHEMENGRLFRLASKLSFVTDRPAEAPGGHGAAAQHAAAYADSGDKYLLGLFRDFVFHQGELEAGRVLDWGHVVEALNKLDAGVSEQVLLQSRDERSLLVVSYADVKRCIEAAIAELRTSGRPQGAGHMMRGAAPPGVGHMFGGR
ncbi:hypothetical protein OEZ85_009321 [Tetradesmus obliquus]|uniref:Pan3 C-terminal knob domain-containing protein n=1 Tax=Tetradesmus obliquus TaxID=3088 RepID=A0ABY8UBI9_TETOB|nr:hypothetical protein OEZ85_009321 [Tetradesmus obliquus]